MQRYCIHVPRTYSVDPQESEEAREGVKRERRILKDGEVEEMTRMDLRGESAFYRLHDDISP